MIYITGDTHFNDTNIISICDRQIGDDDTIRRYLNTLKTTDILIHLGDICLEGTDDFTHSVLFRKFEFKKILVKGNHDLKSDSWYLKNGWDFVCTSFTMSCLNKSILFSHKPRAWDGYFDINVHGHLHNLGSTKKARFLYCKFSLETLGYKPIPLNSLIKNHISQFRREHEN